MVTSIIQLKKLFKLSTERMHSFKFLYYFFSMSSVIQIKIREHYSIKEFIEI